MKKKPSVIASVAKQSSFSSKVVCFVARSGALLAMTLILPSFALAGATSATPAAEAEKAKLKIYYSEPIGAGELVYHITACSKVKSYAPLKCADIDPIKDYKQCKDTKGKIIEGKPVKGCVEEGTKQEAYEEGTTYTKVTDNDIKDFNDGKCADEPANQFYKYVPEWAVVQKMKEKNGIDIVLEEKDYEVHGTIAGDQAMMRSLPEAVLDAIYDPLGDANRWREIRNLYRAGLCATWDVIEKDRSDDISDEQEKILNEIGELTKMFTIANQLMDDGCNASNSQSSSRITNVSTPFNIEPIVTCSLMERITGSSGAEIFSKYVGAIYRWAGGLVGIVAVLVIVFSGVQISVAGDNTALVDEAKHRVMKVIAGLAIFFLAGLILYTINPNFFIG